MNVWDDVARTGIVVGRSYSGRFYWQVRVPCDAGAQLEAACERAIEVAEKLQERFPEAEG